MSCSGASSCRVAEGVSAAGALRHAAKKAMATNGTRLTIAETAFILSSSEIWLPDCLFDKQHLKGPNQNKNKGHAYVDRSTLSPTVPVCKEESGFPPRRCSWLGLKTQDR